MKKSLILFLISIPFLLNAQWHKPPEGPVFNDNNIIRIYITVDPDSLAEMLAYENLESYHEYPAIFNFQDVDTKDTVDNVGFRIRGNTSRFSAKKSFKISFNTFTDGGDYYGLEKINLNGEHNDPSIIRSKLCWDILYDFNVPATRSNHVELYINNEYYGLYMNVEHIDEEFVESRFGNKDGNLYKCLWPSDLVYQGQNQMYYEEIYELKTNTETNDYSDLINLIDVINNTSLANLPSELEKVFNINNFLKFHAVEVFTGHWDSYSYLKNNFYLYHNTATGKLEYIPYDMDNTYGIDWFNIDWANRNIYNWSNDGEYRPLIERLLQIDIYKDRYSYYLNQLIENIVNEDILIPKIENIKNMISHAAEEDLYRTYDYGWSYADFNNSYYNAVSSDHVTYGLIDYIETRLESIENQINITNIDPIIYYTENSLPTLNADIFISALAEDETNNLDIELFYNYNSFESSLMMNRIGDNQMDIYQGSINITEPGTLDYYIVATDSNNNTTRYPVSGEISINIPNEATTGLYINEFMAGNTVTYSDEFGDYDDWIELYNAGSTDIWLGDYYLSDNNDIPNKYKLPNENLGAGEFLIIWADGELDQGIYHADFKLSKDGEEVLLSKLENSNYVTIDYIAFGQIESDISFGKLPDGNGIPGLLNPTPGSANMILVIPEQENKFVVKAYPNPFVDELLIESNTIIESINIISIYGQLVYQDIAESKNVKLVLNVSPGIYFIRAIDEFGKENIIKIMAN